MSNKDIKVDGTPKTYGNGATRHTKEGKGRFDLIPHEVFAPLFERVMKLDTTDPYVVECTPHSIITDIANDRPLDAIIKITIYHYYRDASVLEAIDNNISPESFVHCCWPMFKDLAVHFQKGAEIYGERNCQKGIPAWSFKDSAMRHATQYFNHEEDEPHLISAIWNLWLLAWTFIHELETNTTSDSKTEVVPWINKLREEIKPDFDFKKKYGDTYNKLEKNNCIKVSVAKLRSNDPDEKAKISIEEDVERNRTRMFRLLNMSISIWLEEYITKNLLDKYEFVEVSEEIEKRSIDLVLTFANEDENSEYLYMNIAELGEKNDKHFDVSIGEDYGFENCAFRLSVKLKDGLIQKDLIYFDDKEYNYCIEKEWMKRLEIIISAQTGLCCVHK